MTAITPPPPEGLPEAPQRPKRRSRYDRPRSYISWFGLLLGVALGIGGGLFYTWNVDPVEEVNTAPWQLNEADRNRYLVAIMLNYAYDGNLTATIQRLVDLQLPGDDPIQQVADIACELARTGYVDSNSGLRAVRAMIAFYRGQGKSGCADTLIPEENDQVTRERMVVVPTPTLRPPASKTPTPPGTNEPSPTPAQFSPTAAPSRDFEPVNTQSFCDAQNAGVIEVFVVESDGSTGVPGQPVRVRWDTGESVFYTGLKPERGPGYADFEMEPGRAYIVDMPGLSDPLSSPLVADDCFTEAGEEVTQSWRVFFRAS